MEPAELFQALDQVVAQYEGDVAGLANPANVATFNLDLTYNCNGRCPWCGIWQHYRRNPELRAQEISAARLEQGTHASAYLAPLRQINVSGGEAMLREDFGEIGRYLLREWPAARLHVLSNFLDPELLARRLAELPRGDLSRFSPGTSIDGIGCTHDRMRGLRDAWERVTTSIALVRRDYPQVDVCANFALSQDNSEALWDAYEFCLRQRLPFSLQFMLTDRAFGGTWEPEALRRTYAMVKRIGEDMAQRRSLTRLYEKGRATAGDLVPPYYVWKLPDYHAGRGVTCPVCPSGGLYFFVSAMGDLYFCPFDKDQRRRPLGNLKESHMDELWFSGPVREERERIARCRCEAWNGMVCMIMPALGEIFASHLGHAAPAQQLAALKRGYQRLRAKHDDLRRHAAALEERVERVRRFPPFRAYAFLKRSLGRRRGH